jgi:hypothetical protein
MTHGEPGAARLEHTLPWHRVPVPPNLGVTHAPPRGFFSSREARAFVSSGARVAHQEKVMAKGIERGKKDNKPKLSTKEKQKKKKEKKAAK